MITWGINALNHGSSLAVFANGELSMFEKCHDDKLDRSIIHKAFNYGGPDTIYWYENPWLKKARQIKAKQWHRVFDLTDIPSLYVKELNVPYSKLKYTSHHASHAAAGYYTSPFNHCAIVVLDAIGEFESATIWEGKHGEMKKIWSAKYPNSLGLYYSAFTQMLGLEPIRDEHLLQQMALKGDPHRFRRSIDLYFGTNGPVSLDYNFHRGIRDWSCETWTDQERYNLAAAVQERFEIEVSKVMYKAKHLTGADCLVYMGGCAMNSTANKNEVETKFKYIWSLPDPGDASSSVGAVLYHTKQRLWNWRNGVAKHINIRV